VGPRRRIRTLHSQMEHLIQTQTVTSIVNSIVEISMTLPPLMVTMKRLPCIRCRKAPSRCEGGYRHKGEDRPGDVYLCNTSFNPSDVFSKDMPGKFCANFACKGKKCNNVNCNFVHPRRPSGLKHETILAITDHFTKRDIGAFPKLILCL
jgi:hypothetical protein